MKKRPNNRELLFLNQSYNVFLDIYEEMVGEDFWLKDPNYRLSKLRDALLIYSEILEYTPIKWFLNYLKRVRPPMESELSSDYILFIRNLFIHFPLYRTWEEIYITKNLINWSKPGRSIDKFLSQYAGHDPVKYRMWDKKIKKMTYVSINFPTSYSNNKIWLKDFMSEKEGVMFIMFLMHKVFMSQVESMS